MYNDWLKMNGKVEDVYIRIKKDKIRIATGSEEEVSVLTDEQVEKFLFLLEKVSQRNKCIGYLLLYTGLRVTELVDLKLAHIDRLTA
ncbi:hypothetical protein [Ureibacillus chungkukjangi]|uniref:hypothetical protein n=1 Tax=Ureibacillus chungkukjangi TaxID=1202712 RepID=UPI00203E893C|nr:hypothetical protein [Ureibacillus chungkukjangi]